MVDGVRQLGLVYEAPLVDKSGPTRDISPRTTVARGLRRNETQVRIFQARGSR